MNLELMWRFLVWLVGVSIPTGLATIIVIKIIKGLSNRVTTAVDAYSAESARFLAQSHNLEKLVEQTQRLTITAETIKARVSDEVWDRQMRWTAKRDMYIAVIETLADHIDVERPSQHLEDIVRRLRHAKTTDERLIPQRERLMAWKQDVHSRLVRLACTAPLMISGTAHDALKILSQDIQDINYDEADYKLRSNQNINVLNIAVQAIFMQAKQDLGF